MIKPKIIAFYLPQFHPTKHNDIWWGKGFTEWTNVGKAKKLFRGHYQPKIPADLGYYDLRIPQVREDQANLAREAGVYGFCYYHYWFGDGQQELELPFNEVLKTGNPNFPFMLCWANESWHKKFWDVNGKGTSKQILIKQTYPGTEDFTNHFYHLLNAFKDPRYIKINGMPAFMIYKPLEFPNLPEFIALWRKLAKKEGLGNIFFIGHAETIKEIEGMTDFKNLGLDAINTSCVSYSKDMADKKFFTKWKGHFFRKILKRNIPYKYKKVMSYFKSHIDNQPYVFPSIIPNWDHSPRSGKMGYIITDSTPDLFHRHVIEMLQLIEGQIEPILFLKSWNEWGEGNYMEPDLKFGKGYIEALARAIKDYNQK